MEQKIANFFTIIVTFAFNCRVLETMLHRSFHASRNRLWVKVGAGSYYLSEAALQVCRVRRCAQCSCPHSVATGPAGQQQDQLCLPRARTAHCV